MVKPTTTVPSTSSSETVDAGLEDARTLARRSQDQRRHAVVPRRPPGDQRYFSVAAGPIGDASRLLPGSPRSSPVVG